MIIAAIRKPLRSVGVVALAAACALGGSGLARAQTADSPTTVSAVPNVQKGTVGRQLWRITDYTTVELVAREPGARPNQHPQQIEPNALHLLLQPVQVMRGGKPKPLFAFDELNTLVPALSAALANARPDQDVAVISSARHEDNTFYSVTAVTSRLFFVDGHLNLVVHDARYDFYDTARGTGAAPHFTIGSRAEPGGETLQAVNSTNARPDWLVLGDVVAPPAAAAAPVPVPVPAVVAPAAPTAPAMAAPVAAPATAAAPSPAYGPDAEQRLTTLKHLYDKGLITKSEYESKRAEILKGL